MHDREETVQRLKETAALMDYFQNSCRTMGEGVMAAPWCNIKQYALDAAELLIEQEPVKPISAHVWARTFGRCGNCKAPLPALEGLRSKYCWMCGKAVKWDDA